MAYRAGQQPTQPNVFPSADDEQARVRRLLHQNPTGIPAGDLQHPVGGRRYGLEHGSDRLPVGLLDFFAAQVHEVRRRGKPAVLSPYGQSSTCTARSTAPRILACSAAQSNAALPDGESSSPTTISLFILHPPPCQAGIFLKRTFILASVPVLKQGGR
jgi:hypothetical protein